MKNTSRNINIHGGIDKQDPNVSIPDTWAENSNRNIQDSQGIHLSLRFLMSRSKSYRKKSLFCISLQFTISHLAGARSSSQRLRGDVDNLITQCANDMWSAWNTTNTALQQVMAR